MILEKLNCDFLKVSPFSYENGYNTGILKELQITGKVNNGSLITKNIDLTVPKTTWSIDFLASANIYIKQIYVRNIFTNQLFPLIISEPIATTNIFVQNTVVPRIATVIHTTLNSPATTVTGIVHEDLGNITITNLSHNLIMDKVVFTLLGADQEQYFTYLLNPDMILSNDMILLKPSFFGLDAFVDGIYNITSIVTTTDNILIEEHSCFFWDCEMAGKLQLYTDGTECDPHKMHLLLMHYTLTQSSNNACSCENMYDIFSYLADSLNSVTNEDCGCK